jgi:hypothetical protein
MKLVSLSVRPAVLFAAVLLASLPAAAQGTSEERSACMGDAFKFCTSDIPSVSKIEACLKQNESKLAPACQAEFKPHKKTKMRAEHFR